MTEDSYIKTIVVLCLVACILSIYFYYYGKFVGRKEQYMLTEREHTKSVLYDKFCNRVRGKLQRYRFVVIKRLADGISDPINHHELYFHEIPDSDNKLFEPYDFSKN